VAEQESCGSGEGKGTGVPCSASSGCLNMFVWMFRDRVKRVCNETSNTGFAKFKCQTG